MTKQEKIETLKKLQTESILLAKAQDELVERALKVTEEKDLSGFTFDYILNDFGTAEELLKRFEK